MSLEARKIEFIQRFLRLNDEKIISSFEDLLLENMVEEHRKSLKPMSVEQYREEIATAMEDSKNDRGITAQELKAKYKKWS